MVNTAMLRLVYRILLGKPPECAGRGPDGGLVLVADGVGGFQLCSTSLRYAIARAGSPHEIREVCWGHGLGRWHADLTNVANHTSKSAALAAEVEKFRTEFPGAPVFLVGKSGGTGIIARTLEQLPEGSVERVILLAPALSPTYDLTRALRAVRDEMVVFWSPLDVFVLGLGTWMFGTVDRRPAASAGLRGFRPPQGADVSQYAKLRQVRWQPAMARTGYLGGHVGPDHPRFLQTYVVPLLRLRDESPPCEAPGSSPARAAPIT